MSSPSRRARGLSEALASTSPETPEQSAPEPKAVPTKPERPRKVGIQVYLHEADHQRLKDIAYHSKTTFQQLMIEALNLLMERRGHDPIMPSTNDRPTGRNVG